MAVVTICSDLEPEKIKSVTLSIVSPSTCHEVMGPNAMVLLFWMLSFSQLFPLPSFTEALQVLFAFCHKGGVTCISEVIDISPVILILACASSSLQSFAASGSFPVSQFFASGSQSTGVSASASVLPMNIQDWFPLGWAGWITLQSKGLSRVFFNTTVQKH